MTPISRFLCLFLLFAASCGIPTPKGLGELCEPATSWTGNGVDYHLPLDPSGTGHVSPVVQNHATYSASVDSWNALEGMPFQLKIQGSGFPIDIRDQSGMSSGVYGLAVATISLDGHFKTCHALINRDLIEEHYPNPEDSKAVGELVSCQELGHCLGSGHSKDRSCMNGCQDAPNFLECVRQNRGPAPEDGLMLQSIYAHAPREPGSLQCTGAVVLHAFHVPARRMANELLGL